jgi:hypothetical protein
VLCVSMMAVVPARARWASGRAVGRRVGSGAGPRSCYVSGTGAVSPLTSSVTGCGTAVMAVTRQAAVSASNTLHLLLVFVLVDLSFRVGAWG